MSQISFCIATAKNEKEYIKLLLNSIEKNCTPPYEIVTFIDSDNQNTFEYLLEKKKTMNMKILRNKTNYRFGGQLNISTMFDAASNEIVSNIQSDMIVAKDYDKYLLKSITEDSIICSTRIEPPIHPPSADKYTYDCGLDPKTFDFKKFEQFVKERQSDNRNDGPGHFAPFTVYKKTWFDKIGGFDTQFRCSREDSDSMKRFHLAEIKQIQSWMSMVYHFTCVSSRGIDWYNKNNKEAQSLNNLQQKADEQELKRFIRKWGEFSHTLSPIYNIDLFLDLDCYISDIDFLYCIEPYFHNLYLNEKMVCDFLSQKIEFESAYFSNLKVEYDYDTWLERQPLFNYIPQINRIHYSKNVPTEYDILIEVKYSELIKNYQQSFEFLSNLNKILSQENLDNGCYNFDIFKININQLLDISIQKIKAPYPRQELSKLFDIY